MIYRPGDRLRCNCDDADCTIRFHIESIKGESFVAVFHEPPGRDTLTRDYGFKLDNQCNEAAR